MFFDEVTLKRFNRAKLLKPFIHSFFKGWAKMQRFNWSSLMNKKIFKQIHLSLSKKKSNLWVDGDETRSFYRNEQDGGRCETEHEIQRRANFIMKFSIIQHHRFRKSKSFFHIFSPKSEGMWKAACTKNVNNLIAQEMEAFSWKW